MRVSKALTILTVFASWALLAHASDSANSSVNYDDPNLAFKSEYVGDTATDVASNVNSSTSAKGVKGTITEQAVVLSDATARAVTRRPPTSSAR